MNLHYAPVTSSRLHTLAIMFYEIKIDVPRKVGLF